jgi:hypothetical protein
MRLIIAQRRFGKGSRVWMAKIFVGLPDGETEKNGEADSPIKAARLTALDNKRDYLITMI